MQEAKQASLKMVTSSEVPPRQRTIMLTPEYIDVTAEDRHEDYDMDPADFMPSEEE